MRIVAATLLSLAVLGSSCRDGAAPPTPSPAATPPTAAAGQPQGVAPSPATAPTADQLAALQIKNLAVPTPGLITAGQPTEAQFEALAKLGVKRYVCLRPDGEAGTGFEAEKAKALGVEFVRLPVAGADDLTADQARALAQALTGAGPAVVACGSSNRVGALLALKAFFVDGKSADEALQFGKAAGLKALEPEVQKRLVK
ncbi:MAG: hypothetical protein JNK49_02085 [Planctomycetes bacterium]|nr:hypothetical protein [Planctomycetota bacterium]